MTKELKDGSIKLLQEVGYKNKSLSVNICAGRGKEHLSYHKGNAICSDKCDEKRFEKFCEELKGKIRLSLLTLQAFSILSRIFS